MKQLRYILTIPFFLALPLDYGQAEQSPSWTPPAEQHPSYDSPHQNVLEIAPAQQETTIPQTQQSSPEDSPEDFSLQASLPDDPWYRHQSSNFDDPYYRRQRDREQRITVTRRDTYRTPRTPRPPRQQEYTYADRENEYDDYDQPTLTSTQLPRTYPSTVSQSQASSALWDVARIMSFAVGAQSGLVRYDRCSRQYSFAGVPLR